MSVGGIPAGGFVVSGWLAEPLAVPAGGRSARPASPRALCSPCIVSSPLKGGLSLSALRGGVWGLAGELITPVFSTREPGKRPQSRAIRRIPWQNSPEASFSAVEYGAIEPG